jgi:hypothetical protein
VSFLSLERSSSEDPGETQRPRGIPLGSICDRGKVVNAGMLSNATKDGRRLMRQSWFRAISLLSLPPLLTVGAYAAEYERPTPPKGGQPTSADLQIYDGASRSVTVQLLNLTPYDIAFDYIPGVSWSITSTDQVMMQNDDRHIRKSFMFVPVGIPSLIPGAPEQGFLGPGDPGYDPDYSDTTTHPYSMVFSWDDQGGFVEDNWVRWTIKEVEYKWCDRNDGNCQDRIRDVPLGLWMYRNEPTFNLSSSFLPVLVDALKLTFKTVSLVFVPESPTAWAKAFLATKELAQDAVKFVKQNTQENDGNKMWVASYIIPDPASQCVAAQQASLTCNPEIMSNDSDKTTGDAVYVHWSAEWAGPEEPDGSTSQYAAEQKLVVSVHVLRGQRAPTVRPGVLPKPLSRWIRAHCHDYSDAVGGFQGRSSRRDSSEFTDSGSDESGPAVPVTGGRRQDSAASREAGAYRTAPPSLHPRGAHSRSNKRA